MVFSLIRCWKAHKLWEVSFLRRLAETLAEFARNITYARRLFIYFAAFLIMNLAGAGWIAWTFAKGGTLQSYFIAFGGAVVLLFADGWFFRKFYLIIRKRLLHNEGSIFLLRCFFLIEKRTPQFHFALN